LTLYRVEIHSTAAQQLVTVIEVLSPVNKRPSHEAYQAYQRKRRDLLRSEVHLLEIDLHRMDKPWVSSGQQVPRQWFVLQWSYARPLLHVRWTHLCVCPSVDETASVSDNGHHRR